MATLGSDIAPLLGERFECAPLNEYTRIRTPFLYPDGDVIDLFYTETAGIHTLTDLGETLGWLRLQTPAMRRTPRQQSLVEEVCQSQKVECFKGMLTVRANDLPALADGVLRLSEAAIRVSDLWFTLRTFTAQAAADEVAEYLEERKIPFERAERLIGRSGKGWTVDFHARTPARSSLICVLATGSRAAARRVTDHVVATWVDLSNVTAGPDHLHYVSLFDDTMDVWTPEDFRQLESVSDVALWSRPDEFERLLRGAA